MAFPHVLIANNPERAASRLESFVKYFTASFPKSSAFKDSQKFKSIEKSLPSKSYKKKDVQKCAQCEDSLASFFKFDSFPVSNYMELLKFLLEDETVKTEIQKKYTAVIDAISVHFHRFLIYYIYNFNDKMFLKNNGENANIEIGLLLFKVLFLFPPEVFVDAHNLCREIFVTLCLIFNEHRERYENGPKLMKFIDDLSVICGNYLDQESKNHFVTLEMHLFLLAHSMYWVSFYGTQKFVDRINSVIKHFHTLIQIEESLARKHLDTIFNMIAESSIVSFSHTQKNVYECPIEYVYRFDYFMFTCILTMTEKVPEFCNKLVVMRIPFVLARFFIWLVNNFVNFNYVTENFQDFSTEEPDFFSQQVVDTLYNNRKQKPIEFIRKMPESIISDFHLINERKNYVLKENMTNFPPIAKLLRTISSNQKNKLMILIIDQLFEMVKKEASENEDTVKSATKILVLVNVLINCNEEVISELFKKFDLFRELSSFFVFKEKYLYFTNPKILSMKKNQHFSIDLTNQYLSNDSSSSSGTSSLSEMVPSNKEKAAANENKSNLYLFNEVRKGIFSIFTKAYKSKPDDLLNFIKEKIENSVPQVANIYVSLLKALYSIDVPIFLQSMFKTNLLYYFTNYNQKLQTLFLHYKTSENKDFIAMNIQKYRDNAFKLFILFVNEPQSKYFLFSNLTAVGFLFHELYEKNYTKTVLSMIKEGMCILNNDFYSKQTNFITPMNTIIPLLVTNIKTCIEKMVLNEDFQKLIYNILHVIGIALQSNQKTVCPALSEAKFLPILLSIPNQLMPINKSDDLKIETINKVLFILCGMAKNNPEFKICLQEYLANLAKFLNALDLEDDTVEMLLQLVFEQPIEIKHFPETCEIQFSKCLPFLHYSLWGKPQYSVVFSYIYAISINSFSNKLHIYQSKLLSIIIGEVGKYPVYNVLPEEKIICLNVLLGIFQTVSTFLFKPQTFIDILSILKKSDDKNTRPWYVARVIKMFNDIETSKFSKSPSSFFHFNGRGSGITVPQIPQCQSFTFMCRFELDEVFHEMGISNPRLLSFSIKDTVFEILFNEKNMYVYYCENFNFHKNTSNGKRISTITSESNSILYESNLNDEPSENSKMTGFCLTPGKAVEALEKIPFNFDTNIWYTLIMTISNKGIKFNIDGSKINIGNIKHIKTGSDPIDRFTIANSSPILYNNRDFSLVCNISCVYLFDSILSKDYIKDIMKLPIDYVYSFVPSNKKLYPNMPASLFTGEVESMLTFGYTARMSDGQQANNLTRDSIGSAFFKGNVVPFNSTFVGAIIHMGGMKTFIPLFEQVDFHVIGFEKDNTKDENKEFFSTLCEVLNSFNQASEDIEIEFCKADGIKALAHALSRISRSSFDVRVFNALREFFFSLRSDSNRIEMIQNLWMNFNIWKDLSLELHEHLIKYAMEEIFNRYTKLFISNISFAQLLTAIVSIKNDEVRRIYFRFLILYSKQNLMISDQQLFFDYAFYPDKPAELHVQVFKALYIICSDKLFDCHLNLINSKYYNSIIALSSSPIEEIRFIAVLFLVLIKNFNEKGCLNQSPISLSASILLFIRSLNLSGITDFSWKEHLSICFRQMENSSEYCFTKRIVELLPLLSVYSHYATKELIVDFLVKAYQCINNSAAVNIASTYCERITISANWSFNLFYIYLHTRKPVLLFSEENNEMVKLFSALLVNLLNRGKVSQFKDSLYELYLIQYLTHWDVSAFVRNIFIHMLNDCPTMKTNESVFMATLPEILTYLFFIPSHEIYFENMELLKSYSLPPQAEQIIAYSHDEMPELNWKDLVYMHTSMNQLVTLSSNTKKKRKWNFGSTGMNRISSSASCSSNYTTAFEIMRNEANNYMSSNLEFVENLSSSEDNTGQDYKINDTNKELENSSNNNNDVNINNSNDNCNNISNGNNNDDDVDDNDKSEDNDNEAKLYNTSLIPTLNTNPNNIIPNPLSGSSFHKFYDLRFTFNMRIDGNGVWVDAPLAAALSTFFLSIKVSADKNISIESSIKGKFSDPNSFKITITDFYTINEMLQMRTHRRSMKECLTQVVTYIKNNAKNLSNDSLEQTLSLIYLYAIPYIKSEEDASLIVRSFSPLAEKNKEFRKSDNQFMWLQDFYGPKYANFFEKFEDEASSSFSKQMRQYFAYLEQEIVIGMQTTMPPKHVPYNAQFILRSFGQFTQNLSHLEGVCLKAFRRLRRDVMANTGPWRSSCDSAHWELSAYYDLHFRHIFFKPNSNFDAIKFKTASIKRDESDSSKAKEIIARALGQDMFSKASNDSGATDSGFGDIDDESDFNSSENEDIINKVSYQFKTQAKLVTVRTNYNGVLSMNTHEIFFSGTNEEDETISKTVQISMDNIHMILLRNYLHIPSAFEIFLVTNRSFFFYLPQRNNIRKKLMKFIKKQSPPNCKILQISKSQNLIGETKIVERWLNGNLSNYDYLMWLNLFSGRSFNDLSQYPVFPWVLSNYETEKLDLSDPSIFRDFSKPIGALNQNRLEKLKILMEENPEEGNYLYRFHYSTAYYIALYMLRCEPFTSVHIKLQNGKFDNPLRLFQSLPTSWVNMINESGRDFKEMIPEMFTTPEILINRDGFDLGLNGKLNQVDLPKWAKSPSDFIRLHRMALESEYVSNHLNEWIDLIFGYKQQGKYAVEANNTFHPYSYPSSVNKSTLKDEEVLPQIQSHALNFGIVPNQLFTSPHPVRILQSSLIGRFNAWKTHLIKTFSSKPLFIESDDNKYTIVLSSDAKLTMFLPNYNTNFIMTSSNCILNNITNINNNSTNTINANNGSTNNSTDSISNSNINTNNNSIINNGNDSISSNNNSNNSSNNNTSINNIVNNNNISNSNNNSSSNSICNINYHAYISPIEININNFFNNNIPLFENVNILENHSSSSKSSNKEDQKSTYSEIVSNLSNSILLKEENSPKTFCYINNVLVVASLWDSSLHFFKIEPNGGGANLFASCQRFSLISAVRACGEKSLITASRDTSLIMWSIHDDGIKMNYQITPHSTSLVDIDTCSSLNLLISADKAQKVIISRLNDGRYIRSFKSQVPITNILINEAICILISSINEEISNNCNNNHNNNNQNINQNINCNQINNNNKDSIDDNKNDNKNDNINNNSNNNSNNDFNDINDFNEFNNDNDFNDYNDYNEYINNNKKGGYNGIIDEKLNINNNSEINKQSVVWNTTIVSHDLSGEKISNICFQQKKLNSWCCIKMNFCDLRAACAFDDKTLVVLGLPGLEVISEMKLDFVPTLITFNNRKATIIVASNENSIYEIGYN